MAEQISLDSASGFGLRKEDSSNKDLHLITKVEVFTVKTIATDLTIIVVAIGST